jgi:small multidrug resistance pump
LKGESNLSYSWFWVALAIVFEITAALSLRYSNGFTKPAPTALALVAFGAAFFLISLALKELPVSIVYPIWAGSGTAGVALLGILALKEKANYLKLVGLASVVIGIVVLNVA